jgi:hypothetical protein
MASRPRPKENSGFSLLLWLNAPSIRGQSRGQSTKASRQRIASLIAAIREAEVLLASIERENPNVDYFDAMPEALAERLSRIQTMLDQYPKWPTVELAYADIAPSLIISEASGRGRPLGEQIAVWDIIDLVSAGRLHFVRQCDCEKWFFARRLDQQSCSPGCRHRTYEQTERFKVKRREYMRNYYKLKQSGKVK